ncbi:uncharacterized protein LOC116742267 [Phocoena sinus]|uniref:uncharacterized protein LOC116742267 n=1 Tax=Phocoena sinus TaxID=42100 RepID=UPI0013C4B9EE|nr:uncharacterized protein LOC116742267 [Phocoena sinus]
MPARLAPDALRPTALPLPAPCAARSLRPGPRATFLGLLGPGPAAGLLGAGRTPERPDLAERRSGSAAAAACRPACGTAGPAAPARSFGVFGVNLCLLPDGLAHNQRRAETVGAVLLAGLRHSPYGATGCTAWHPVWARCRTTWHIRPAARATPEAAGQRAAAGLALPAATRRFPVLPHARREDALASKGLLSAQVPAHRPRRSGTRKGAGHGVERAKVPKRSWASRTGAASWAFLHCTHLHSPREDGLLRRTQLTLLLDWAELSEVESRQSDEAVAFSVRLGDLNFDNCALTNAAEILPSPPLRGLLRGDAEGLGAGGRGAATPWQALPEHWRAGAWTTSPTEEDPEAF